MGADWTNDPPSPMAQQVAMTLPTAIPALDMYAVMKAIDKALAEAVAKEREAIMQSIETRRARHGTGCDCKSFDTLGAMLEEIGARGKEQK